MPSLIDLHIHSKFSDGQFDIKQLVELSRANGVGLISITDHDDIRSSLELKNNSDIKETEYVNYQISHHTGAIPHADGPLVCSPRTHAHVL